MDELDRHDPGVRDRGLPEDRTTNDLEQATDRPVDRFRRSAAGSVVAAGLLGLRDALEGRPEKDEPAIVAEGPERAATDNIDVFIDFEHPEQSFAVVRRPHAGS